MSRKPASYYDDWVYIGKETYGSRHVSSRAIKPGTRFFDVLGRAYDKMKSKIKYYVFKDAVEKSESTWRYYNEGQYWQERCWYKEDLNNTYMYEVAHIKNCRNEASRIAKSAIAITYDAIEKCGEQANEERIWLDKKWKLWYEKEQNHTNPNSPKYGGFRLVDKPCN